jgi:1-deoxy-D-xylulose-5-phosphate reductoisomerase
LVILGSTGSIGVQALDVLARAGAGEFQILGLSAGTDSETLVGQAQEHGVRRIALADPTAAARASEMWTGETLAGPDGLVQLITESDCDLVLNAIVGSAGLVPTVATLGEGIDLALANKESLVVGGELVMQLAEATGANMIPVDSEHSALHQLLSAERGVGTVERLIITASGGPFRGRAASHLEDVTVEQALAHPTWSMGGKITIDSATLMNKGLEVIEAHHLFDTPYEQIEVVVHPQSIIHSLIGLCDGATLAHLGYPDMQVPIAYALHYPERVEVPIRSLDLIELGALTFEPVDLGTFSCLRLAREAGLAGGTAPCILNAANEIAVYAFLGGRVRFLDIAAVIEETLERLPSSPVHSFDSLADADREARRVAGELVHARAGA